MSLLDGLNPAQRAAAECLDGPVLILAGAGSGKTRTLTHRAAHLLQEGRCLPYDLLVVTFTNKAAGELRERLGGLLGAEQAKSVWAMTFHGLCVRILRKSGPLAGVPNDFTIVDTADSRKLLAEAAQNLEFEMDSDALKKVRSVISRGKNAGATYQKLLANEDKGWQRTGQLWREYDRLLEEAGGLDFDDLLLKAVSVLRTDKGAVVWGHRFRYVMADEHQDANGVQEQLLRLLCGLHNNICVVGDEQQSIYGFRGAEVQNILRFESEWPGCQVFKLEDNYRSQAHIINAANAVIAHATEKLDKILRPTKPAGTSVRLLEFNTHWDEGRFVADRITQIVKAGHSLDHIAIAYRTNAQSHVLEEKLLERGIPYRVVGGVEFNRRVEVQGARAYLSLLSNRRDRLAFERAVGWPKRGVGPSTVKLVLQHAREHHDAHLRPAMKAVAAARPAGVNVKAAAGLAAFAELLDRAEGHLTSQTLDVVLRDVLERSGILDVLREQGDEGRDKLENLDQLVGLAERFPGPAADALPLFLEATALNDVQPGDDDATPAVTLMTLHATKGLEFEFVFLPGMEQDLFLRADSRKKDIEEARRLLYVGMTRAETELVMSYARTRRMWGREQLSRPLQFLRDLPPQPTVAFQRQAAKSGSGSSRPGAPAYRRPAGRPAASASSRAPMSARTAMASMRPASEIARPPQSKPKPAADRSVRSSDYRAGQHVSHQKFGLGVVSGVRDGKVSVRFAGGVKDLAVEYARLQVIS